MPRYLNTMFSRLEVHNENLIRAQEQQRGKKNRFEGYQPVVRGKPI